VTGLRALSSRAKDWLIGVNDRDREVQEAIAAARRAGRRQASREIARAIRESAPVPHRPGSCPGVASCPACSQWAQAGRLAELAELTGAQQ
jgi:hypothetical protein